MKIVVLEADAAGVSFDELGRFGELVTYEHTPQELVAPFGLSSDSSHIVSNPLP